MPVYQTRDRLEECLINEKQVIKVVDDIMGSGKSSWAINYINKNQDKRFLCIVPLLTECDRFKRETETEIIDPEKWGSKWQHFKWLIENNKNIVTTHSLIQKMDLDMLELLKSKDYVLMIDECLSVLDTYKITRDDLKIIFNEKLVSLDEKGFLVWNDDKPYQGVYGDVKRLCSFKSLMGFKKDNSDELARIIMWNFPVDFFKCFEESYIFTYLWDGSIQKAYFDIHNIQYEKYMLDDERNLIKHNKDLEYEKRRRVVSLINIYDGKFNKIGLKIGKANPLSKSWYSDKKKKNRIIFEQLKTNTENYFRTVAKTNSGENMYTVFKQFRQYVKGKGYAKGYVPCNARGTNEFKDKKSLAYLINFYMTPDVKQFVTHYSIEFDEDLCSLSSLLQWIWRSQIRDGEPINIFIPSERMRGLLNNWIEECILCEKAA